MSVAVHTLRNGAGEPVEIEMLTVSVSARFWDDHEEREPEGVFEVLVLGRLVTKVALDFAAARDLLSDAWYYSDSIGFEPDSHGRSLRDSARRTFAKLIESWPEHWVRPAYTG